MFDRRQPKLFYNAKLLRVMITLRRSHTLSLPQPPLSLIEKTEAKLLRERAAGKIDHFEIFDTRLAVLWEKLRNHHSIGDGEEIVLTLASASPPGMDIFIDKNTNHRGVANLTAIDAKARWKNLSINTFKFTVRHQLKQANITGYCDPACIHYAYIMLLKEGLINNFPLVAADPALKEDATAGRPYRLTMDESRQRVSLVLSDPLYFIKANGRQSFFEALISYTNDLSSKGEGAFTLLHRHLERSLIAALNGPERFGLDLPAIMLAAYRLPQESVSLYTNLTKPVSTLPPKAKVLATPRPCPFRIAVRQGGMYALVSGGGDRLATYPGALDEAWWIDYLNKQGIVYGLDSEGLARLTRQIKRGGTVEDIVVARGDKPLEASEAELRTILDEPKTRSENDRATIDFRHEASLKRFARAGDVVARVVYTQPAIPGKTVRGEELAPPPSTELVSISVGKGLEQKDDMTLVALHDGTLERDDNSIWLERSLVVDGDVNLTSGDIHFDGPVEIKGNVEGGSSVVSGSDIIIHGSVSSARVISHGGLVIKGGVIGGGKAIILVRGDLTVDFIENANVTCHGTIQVARGIIGGLVACQKRIVAKSDSGVIAGGEIHCWQEIVCQQLGRGSGTETRITMGRSFLWQIALNRRLARVTALQAAMVETHAMLKSILTRSSAQLTKTHVKVRAHLTERLANIHALLEKMRRHVEQAREQITLNPNARIHVFGTLSQNVRIEMGSAIVPIKHDVQEASILTTKVRGEHLIALDPSLKKG